jgi:hypothetical protein
MKLFFTQKQNFFLVLIGIVIVSSSLVYLLTTGNTLIHRPPTLQATSQGASPTKQIVPTPTPHPFCKLSGRQLELGIANPRWQAIGYGEGDVQWLTETAALRTQTSACWVEMPLLFHQASSSATQIVPSELTPDLNAFIYGVRYAHQLGLHVFAVPQLQTGSQDSWAGSIQFATEAEEQSWFQSYWAALKPYIQAAAHEGVEQIAIGTELEWLQENAPDQLWNTLIDNFRSVYTGSLTYDLNWTSLQAPIPDWMHNNQLNMIGVSAYISLTDTPQRIDPTQITMLWAQTVKVKLDSFAAQLGAPIFISEIGYRNSADALYHTWESQSNAPKDETEQAAAYSAAFTNIIDDENILGVFVWGWDDTGSFNVQGLQAVTTIHHYYSSLHP